MARRRRRIKMDDLVRGISPPSDRRALGGDADETIDEQPESAPPITAPPATSKPLKTDVSNNRRRPQRNRRVKREQSVGGVDDADYSRTSSEFTKFIYLSTKEIEAIHMALIERFADSDDPIDSLGPREDGHLLRSATFRPMTGMRTVDGGEAKYPSVTQAAAALTHSLIHNHPFADGNKRTATLSLIAFLYQNKMWFEATEEDLYNAIVDVATHQFPREKILATNNISDADPDEEVEAFARWLDRHVIDLAHQIQPMQWCKVRTLLIQRGCSITRRSGNKISIERRGRRTRRSLIGARNDGDELDRRTIRKLLEDLHLPSLHTPIGGERNRSRSFIESAIDEWRTVLERLGELDRGRR